MSNYKKFELKLNKMTFRKIKIYERNEIILDNYCLMTFTKQT